jgi:hypothetical protein
VRQRNPTAPWSLARQDCRATLNLKGFQYEPPAKIQINRVARQLDTVAPCTVAQQRCPPAPGGVARQRGPRGWGPSDVSMGLLPRRRAWRDSFKLPRHQLDMKFGQGLVLKPFEVKRGRAVLPCQAPWRGTVLLPRRPQWRGSMRNGYI